ncbi:uncharacterized protein I206_106030 [Kwoniella pini CBS 10737]|uniref:Uncharacterized protein n=1 Tax=Kwoniella pini CBS 10737 TaxID=1296096 RepID=A0A1B9I0X8_9TREE|nr:uncharacterized protein I206_04853 [Kwoniella pini CBS 10737]OCF49165.1 hypothetical protein I206_04853 [Kwoniella pini CBS 10737]
MTTTPPLPKLIITPSTPLTKSNFEITNSLPSSRKLQYTSNQQISSKSEKPRLRSSSISSYHSFSNFSDEKEEEEEDEKSKLNLISSLSLPSNSYLNLPNSNSNLQRQIEKKQKFKSTLISIFFIIFTFLLIIFTTICTSSTSSSVDRILKIQIGLNEKFTNLLSLRGNYELDLDIPIREDHNSEPTEIQTSGNGLFDFLFWQNDDSFTHSIISAGPAISLDGAAIWDFDSLSL